MWKNTFGGDTNIVGQSIRLKSVPYTVIGVLPARAQTPSTVDLWILLRPDTSEEGGGDNFEPILRLKTGATREQANGQLSRLESLTSRFVQKKNPGAQVSYNAVPLQQTLAVETQTPAMILMAAVGFVLLVACANLAGLALVRVGRREAEIATRLALGATKWAILRQFWMESLLLTTAGGIAALLVGGADPGDHEPENSGEVPAPWRSLRRCARLVVHRDCGDRSQLVLRPVACPERQPDRCRICLGQRGIARLPSRAVRVYGMR